MALQEGIDFEKNWVRRRFAAKSTSEGNLRRRFGYLQDSVKVVGSDWTVEQLRALYDYIDRRGTEDNVLSYGAARIPGRSAEEIHELVEWIRTSIRNEQRNHAIAQTQIWVNTPNATQLPTSPEVNTWSQAVEVVQSRKRKIQDCTKQAMAVVSISAFMRIAWSHQRVKVAWLVLSYFLLFFFSLHV
uniref:Uncharacterized protein n=1 Tax=Ascaris lumbricoides TaxID=6252 RepID=A0A0M3IDU2_ASCLU